MAETPLRIMHPGFAFFPDDHVEGAPVQIDLDWLDNAAAAIGCRRTVGATASLRILELAYPGEMLDFHLSFKCEAGFAGQAHFCIRRVEDGKNASLYWFYQLVRRGDGVLRWCWQGCAGKGEAERLARYRPPFVQYGTSAGFYLTRLLAALAPPRGSLVRHAGRWTLKQP